MQFRISVLCFKSTGSVPEEKMSGPYLHFTISGLLIWISCTCNVHVLFAISVIIWEAVQEAHASIMLLHYKLYWFEDCKNGQLANP